MRKLRTTFPSVHYFQKAPNADFSIPTGATGLGCWPWRAGLLPARAADTKPDKKKSQAALQRGKKADEAGKRDDAIAAYTEAVQADASNVEAWRRARQRLPG